MTKCSGLLTNLEKNKVDLNIVYIEINDIFVQIDARKKTKRKVQMVEGCVLFLTYIIMAL